MSLSLVECSGSILTQSTAMSTGDSLECGGFDAAFFVSFFDSPGADADQFGGPRKAKEKNKESGVKPPHSKTYHHKKTVKFPQHLAVERRRES